jgi:hypothetical protein
VVARHDVPTIPNIVAVVRLLCIPVFLVLLFGAGASDIGIADWFQGLAWLCGVPGLVFSYYAAWQYVPLARGALAEATSGARPSPTIR